MRKNERLMDIRPYPTSLDWHTRGIDTPNYAFDIVTEPAVHEMTLDEIEEKLGYKVKIVNKENGK